MTLRYLIIFSLLIFSSCRPEIETVIEEDIEESIQPRTKNPIILIDHQEDGTILYLRTLASFSSIEPEIFSYTSGLDTLILKEKSEIVKISSPDHFEKDIFLQPNDTLLITFKDSTIQLTGNVVYSDSIKISNEKIYGLQKKFDTLTSRYFDTSKKGFGNLEVQNQYGKKILTGGGFYKKDLMRNEPDSIRELIKLSRDIAKAKIAQVNESKEFSDYSSYGKTLLNNRAQSEYYDKIKRFGGYLDGNPSININLVSENLDGPINKNDIIFNSTDPESIQLAKKYFPDDIENNRYGISHFHQLLNVIQSKYATNGKQHIKSKFYKAYQDLPLHLEARNLQIARAVCIYKMMSWNEPWKEIERAYGYYVAEYGSDDLIKGFEDQNKRKLKSINDSDQQMRLASLDQRNNIKDLDGLLERFKGKPIYIDFWASWCPPCIEAIPFSRKLDERMDGEVHFIYLSIDMNETNWKHTSHRYELPANKSFIILNYESSDFIKKFNVTEIPRYMIFDSDGKMVESLAESPKSEELFSKLKTMTNSKS